jgi:hypothetical protein
MDNPQYNLTPAEFFSRNYRLSCSLDARRRSLGDILYDPTSSYVFVEDAYISPIDYPARISTDYPKAIIVKDSLTFALTPEQDSVFRRDQKYGHYLGPNLEKVFIALPYVELQGELLMPGRTTPQVLLSSSTEGFITLLDVKAHVTSNPEITYEGEAAIVSKNKISFMGLLD